MVVSFYLKNSSEMTPARLLELHGVALRMIECNIQ